MLPLVTRTKISITIAIIALSASIIRWGKFYRHAAVKIVLAVCELLLRLRRN